MMNFFKSNNYVDGIGRINFSVVCLIGSYNKVEGTCGENDGGDIDVMVGVQVVGRR